MPTMARTRQHRRTDAPAEVVQTLLEALAALRDVTRSTEVTIRSMLKKVNQGADLSDTISGGDPATARHAMNEALKEVERARHEVRLAVFAEALDRGTSIGQLGRVFGFSRQLAARYAKEARGEV